MLAHELRMISKGQQWFAAQLPLQKRGLEPLQQQQQTLGLKCHKSVAVVQLRTLSRMHWNLQVKILNQSLWKSERGQHQKQKVAVWHERLVLQLLQLWC